MQHNREKWLNWRCEEDYETLCTSEFLTGFLFGLLALLWFIMFCFMYRAELKHCESHQVFSVTVKRHSALRQPTSCLHEVIRDTNKMLWLVWEDANLKWHHICYGLKHIYR